MESGLRLAHGSITTVIGHGAPCAWAIGVRDGGMTEIGIATVAEIGIATVAEIGIAETVAEIGLAGTVAGTTPSTS